MTSKTKRYKMLNSFREQQKIQRSSHKTNHSSWISLEMKTAHEKKINEVERISVILLLNFRTTVLAKVFSQAA